MPDRGLTLALLAHLLPVGGMGCTSLSDDESGSCQDCGSDDDETDELACNALDEIHPLGRVGAVDEAESGCAIAVQELLSDETQCTIPGPLRVVRLDGSEERELTESAGAFRFAGEYLLWVEREAAPARVMAAGDDGFADPVELLAVGDGALLAVSDRDQALFAPLTGGAFVLSPGGDEGDEPSLPLSDAGVVSAVTRSPAGILVHDPEPISPCLQAGPLHWISLDGQSRTEISRNATGLRAVHPDTGAIVYGELEPETGVRQVVVRDRVDGRARSVAELAPIEAFAEDGCGGIFAETSFSPDGSLFGLRRVQITLEPGGLGGYYPDLELALHRTASPADEVGRVPCDSESSEVLDDAVLCRDNGLEILRPDQSTTVIDPDANAVETLDEQVRVYERQLHDRDLIDGLFIPAQMRRLDLGTATTDALGDGYLFAVHRSAERRWIISSDRPAPWYHQRTTEVSWSVRDLSVDEPAVIDSGHRRPEQILGDGRVLLLKSWASGQCEDSDDAVLAPLP